MGLSLGLIGQKKKARKKFGFPVVRAGRSPVIYQNRSI